MPEAVSEAKQVNGVAINLIRGDITELDVDAFVFYAQHDLALGTGFGTAISVRGGPTIQQELDEIGSVETGGAVVTAAGNLEAEFIIHAVGPRFQEEDIEGKLRATMQNCLRLAEEKKIARVAFPAMGAGYYGIPNPLCAEVMLDEIQKHVGRDTAIKEIAICVFDTPQNEAFRGQLNALN